MVIDLYMQTLLGSSGSIVVCLSPLTSLMMEQTAKFTRKGINTGFLGETQTDPLVIRDVLKGAIQLVYISPEALLYNSVYRNMLLTTPYKQHLMALVIDEAHCIKTWYVILNMHYSYICNYSIGVTSSELHLHT